MNFDEIIDRTGRGAVKYSHNMDMFGTEDVMPMWVADMDFRSPQCVTDALVEELQHGVLGYHEPMDDYFEAIIKWQKDHRMFEVEKGWINFVPGVVTAIAVSINALTDVGDKIVVQTPVYFPFFEYVKRNNRQVVTSALLEQDGRYFMDYVDLEVQFAAGAKMLILCSPHNPAGRIWSREELDKVAVLAEKYGVVVVVDEIHADLPLHGNEVVSYATLSPEAAAHSITLTAPSKIFNIAGLAASYSIIPNDSLRRRWVAASDAYELYIDNYLGRIAQTAAYTHGEPWRLAMLKYVSANVDFAIDYIESHIPLIKAMRPEASFLLWLDCRAMDMTNEELKDFFSKKAKLGLSAGDVFGEEGSGFMRLNFAVPRRVLNAALESLRNAFL